MKIIGLTGGIGSGKSTAARFLSELGARVLDADKLGHDIYKPSTDGWREVVAIFGRQILNENGEIDRKKLGKAVFSDAEALSKLNRVIHPRITEMINARLEEYRQQKVKVAVIEAALLIEAGWAQMVDEVWVVTASEAPVLERLQRKGISREQALARIYSQLSPKERLKHACVTISNDDSLEDLKNKMREMWGKLA
jgi:dephospho-CoA kinase